MMKRLAVCPLLLVLALNALGHTGEVHKYMGTVATVHEASFELTKTDGKSMSVLVSQKTAYVFANGTAATRAELAAGKRVVVTVATDGKTASEIKFARK